jgi:hypothetical protein
MIDVEVPLLRVDWRPDLTTRWSLISPAVDTAAADEIVERTLRQHGGYCRVVWQYVMASSPRPGVWERLPPRVPVTEEQWRAIGEHFTEVTTMARIVARATHAAGQGLVDVARLAFDRGDKEIATLALQRAERALAMAQEASVPIGPARGEAAAEGMGEH